MDKIANHDDFINALYDKNKIRLVFFSHEDNECIERICAPLDYGPSRRKGQIIDGGKNKYHFWDYDSDTKQHTLSLQVQKIQSLQVISEKFNPRIDFDFDINKVEWLISRNW